MPTEFRRWCEKVDRTWRSRGYARVNRFYFDMLGQQLRKRSPLPDEAIARVAELATAWAEREAAWTDVWDGLHRGKAPSDTKLAKLLHADLALRQREEGVEDDRDLMLRAQDAAEAADPYLRAKDAS